MNKGKAKGKPIDDKTRCLARIFQELQTDKESKHEEVDDSSASENSLNVNNLETRSWNKYSTLPASTMAPPTPPSASTPTADPTPTSSVPIRVLLTTFSVREFTADYADYSAQQFITLCEDVMKGSTVTTDGDRISFVRSSLAPGSRALHVMQTSLFT